MARDWAWSVHRADCPKFLQSGAHCEHNAVSVLIAQVLAIAIFAITEQFLKLHPFQSAVKIFIVRVMDRPQCLIKR